MFAAAEKFGQECPLSRMLRREAVRVGRGLPADKMLFVNTHPAEVVTAELIASLRELRAEFPAQQLTIEIHEAAATDLGALIELRSILRELRMQLAFDDFGAGQSRLLELTETLPDFVKFDMQLIRGIHKAAAPRRGAGRAGAAGPRFGHRHAGRRNRSGRRAGGLRSVGLRFRPRLSLRSSRAAAGRRPACLRARNSAPFRAGDAEPPTKRPFLSRGTCFAARRVSANARSTASESRSLIGPAPRLPAEGTPRRNVRRAVRRPVLGGVIRPAPSGRVAVPPLRQEGLGPPTETSAADPVDFERIVTPVEQAACCREPPVEESVRRSDASQLRRAVV